MRSKADMLKQLGVRRSIGFAGASLAAYAVMMLAVSMLTQPVETGDAIAALVMPAAQATERAPQTETVETGLPAWGESTVFFPDAFPPVTGEAAAPIEQF